jgi:hypothetical protein
MAKRVHALTNSLARRPWTPAERRVVLNGFFGRSLIAIEPAVCASVFALLVGGLIRANRPDAPAIVLAPIFGLGVVAFVIYAIGLMVAPTRALLETFGPIYVVDGYVRYRRPDLHSVPRSNGYVAVLNEDRQMLCEWETTGPREPLERTEPALVQFAPYGGIIAIDGRRTALLPENFPALGIGAEPPTFTG